MIIEINDNLEDNRSPKITELADKLAALSYSISESFKQIKKMNDKLKASNV